MADTRRDIMAKVALNCRTAAEYADEMGTYYTGDPAVAGPAKTFVDAINAQMTAITAAMAAYTAASP
jgi:hypothetical protein